MSQQLNLTEELARLLCFAGKVAVAIRTYSAYNQDPTDSRKGFAPLDVMWLSDCLHGIEDLGNAVLAGDTARIALQCTLLTAAYHDYSLDKYPSRPSLASFERNARWFSLQEGIDIFEAISRKVGGWAGGACSGGAPVALESAVAGRSE
jgi:hypothetical protein